MIETTPNPALMTGAALTTLAALLHLVVILVGPRGYHWFGAGNRVVRAAQAGSLYPAMVTAFIGTMLLAWAAYALSGAGAIRPLPLLRPALTAITAVYLLRAVLGPFALINNGRSARFVWVSSGVCLVYGLVHLLGLVQRWNALAV